MDHDEIVRLYGPWRAHTPEDVRDFLRGYGGHWWIAGGWAIEAFSGVHRPHGDIDPSIPLEDVPLLRAHLSGTLDVWAADAGSLRPLTRDDEALSPTCGNLWLRASGAEPWEYDVILETSNDPTWTFGRDARVTLPWSEILWERDGIAYLRPEIQLLYKAKGMRPQDEADLQACLPLLDTDRRGWLRDALDVAHPEHPWRDRL